MRINSHTSPQGILVFCLTRAPAATMAFFSTHTPSSRVAPAPTNASSSTVHPCKTALWPAHFKFVIISQDPWVRHPWQDYDIFIQNVTEHDLPTVTLSPMMVGKTFPLKLDFATWTRELSCILVPDPTLMLLTSPAQMEPQLDKNKQYMIHTSTPCSSVKTRLFIYISKPKYVII